MMNHRGITLQLLYFLSLILLASADSRVQFNLPSVSGQKKTSHLTKDGRKLQGPKLRSNNGQDNVMSTDVTIRGVGDSSSSEYLSWFRPGSTKREKWLGLWLLIWNSIALLDALMFTFRAKQNLDGYLVGEWGPHTMAQTRVLANCQLGLIASSSLIALTSNERQLKNMFKILILCTLGAFRAVYFGVKEGTVKAPWKTGYAAVMSLPPLLLLGYFAFVF